MATRPRNQNDGEPEARQLGLGLVLEPRPVEVVNPVDRPIDRPTDRPIDRPIELRRVPAGVAPAAVPHGAVAPPADGPALAVAGRVPGPAALEVVPRAAPTAPADDEAAARSEVPSVPRAPRIFAVGELVRAARIVLEARFGDVRVEGEVSGFKRSGPGHLYFCVKDTQAALDCVMYAREASRLRFQIEDGMTVRLRGRLTIYEGRGRFQMTVTEIEPTGAGAWAIAFEQLKKKLEAEGLFAASRKRRLPFLPRRIGVVTSPQGAVIRDITRVAHRRCPVAILLAPTPVQGPAAAPGIVAALERLARVPDVDVIIVARGGGSTEDLWCFNDESVARAIAASPVPVISAVGHETDFTISDFVADLRAPTPSAAAELAVPVMADVRADLTLLGNRAARGVGADLRAARLLLERGRTRLGDPRRLLDDRRQLVDDLVARAHRATARRLTRERAGLAAIDVALARAHPHRRIAQQRAALEALTQQLSVLGRRGIHRRRGPLEGLAHKLDALSPRRVLERGYSLAFGPDGHLLTDASAVAAGQPIRVALQRGELQATVTGRSREAGPPAAGPDDPEGTAK